MAVALKAGARLKSSVCDTQVMVVKAPAGEHDLRCGGAPMLGAAVTASGAASLDPAAAHIKRSGVSCVALLDVNSAAVPVAIFGAAYASVPYVPLSYRLTRREINELLARVAPALLVTSADYRELVEPRAWLEAAARET
jgi:acyl-CoA synthetase (AMP-forming)/AMP-acid ligase II